MALLKDFCMIAGVAATLFILDYRLAAIATLTVPPVFAARTPLPIGTGRIGGAEASAN